MTLLSTDPDGARSRGRRAKIVFGVAGAGALALVLGACGNSDQVNAYTDSLNAVQLKINSVVGATTSSEAFQASLAENLPAIQADIAQLKSAEGNLSSEAKAVAQECTGDVTAIVSGLEAIGVAVQAKDNKAVTAARTTTNVEIESLKTCIANWNTSNGTG
ncbi:MAG: hypothetical protein WC054_11505 [Candidatus Nanopelagicales bacterium]